jgi:NAD-dependent dihydropyrimidine dehydrogenase PreA subunit
MKILLNYSDETLDKPILASIIREKDVLINILRAYADGRRGEMLVEVPDEVADEIVISFKNKGVDVHVGSLIELDKELCVDCGACVSVCPTGAVHFEEDRSVTINQSKCIQCALCVDSCPRFAIKLMQGGAISFSSL